MSLIPDEKVPEGVDSVLAEYLKRMFRFAQLSDDISAQLTGITAVPDKPIIGKEYFFSEAVEGTEIIVLGYWGYLGEIIGWVQLSDYPEPANAPTLINGWANIGGGDLVAGYYRYGRRVYLDGHITGGVSGSVCLVLPVGYRPSATVEFMCFSISGGGGSGGHAYATITTNGNVTLTMSGSATDVSLDNTSFRI